MRHSDPGRPYLVRGPSALSPRILIPPARQNRLRRQPHRPCCRGRLRSRCDVLSGMATVAANVWVNPRRRRWLLRTPVGADLGLVDQLLEPPDDPFLSGSCETDRSGGAPFFVRVLRHRPRRGPLFFVWFCGNGTALLQDRVKRGALGPTPQDHCRIVQRLRTRQRSGRRPQGPPKLGRPEVLQPRKARRRRHGSANTPR